MLRHLVAVDDWPTNGLLQRLYRINQDAKVDPEAAVELPDLIPEILGQNENPTENPVSTLPLCKPAPETYFDNHVFVFICGQSPRGIDSIEDPVFDVKGEAQRVLDTGGEFLACGTCLDLRNSAGSEICPLSMLKDHYEVVRDSDKLVTI